MTKEKFPDEVIFPKIFLQFLHHLLVSLADNLVVDNRPGIVHPDNASSHSLYGDWSLPGLVDELHWHSGELGEIFPDILTLRVNVTPVTIITPSLKLSYI